MKKKLFLIAITVMLCILTACGNNTDTSQRTPSTNSKTVQDVLNEQMIQETAAPETPSQQERISEPEPIIEPAAPSITEEIKPVENIVYDNIDIDLTQMSSTLVYSEVYNMISNPSAYEGKVVKMSGMYTYAEGGTQIYHACIIADATACCQQGMEFVPTDINFVAPEVGTQITVTGTFTIYYEGANMYVTLKDAIVEN